MCKGIAALWVRLQDPCGASFRCKEPPLSPWIQGISRHLCISVLLYDSTKGRLGEGKDWDKPLVSFNSCDVPGESSKQNHGEWAVKQQLCESFCIANWEGDWGTDKLVVFLGFGAYCWTEQPEVCISVFPKTSNRISHLYSYLASVCIGFHPLFSDPEGCIADGLGHSGIDSKTGSQNQAFSSSSSETQGKDDLRACVHLKCGC